jgi:hypothetical protein
MSATKVEPNPAADSSRSLVVMGRLPSDADTRSRSTQSLRSAEGRRKVLRWLQASGWWHPVDKRWDSTTSTLDDVDERYLSPCCSSRKVARVENEKLTQPGSGAEDNPLQRHRCKDGALSPNSRPSNWETLDFPQLPAHILSILSRAEEELMKSSHKNKSVEIGDTVSLDPDDADCRCRDQSAQSTTESQTPEKAKCTALIPLDHNSEAFDPEGDLGHTSKAVENEACPAYLPDASSRVSTPAQPRRRLTGAQRRRFDRACEAAQQLLFRHDSKSVSQQTKETAMISRTEVSPQTPNLSPLSADRLSPTKRRRRAHAAAVVTPEPKSSVRAKWPAVVPAQRRLCFESSSESNSSDCLESEEETVTEESSTTSSADAAGSMTSPLVRARHTPVSLRAAQPSSALSRSTATQRARQRRSKSEDASGATLQGEHDKIQRISRQRPKSSGRNRGSSANRGNKEPAERATRSTNTREASPNKRNARANTTNEMIADESSAVTSTAKSMRRGSAQKSEAAKKSPQRTRGASLSAMPKADSKATVSSHEEHAPDYWQAQRERASARQAVFYNARYWSQANMAAYVARLHTIQARTYPHLSVSPLLLTGATPLSACSAYPQHPLVQHLPAEACRFDPRASGRTVPCAASVPVSSLYAGPMANQTLAQSVSTTESESAGSIPSAGMRTP